MATNVLHTLQRLVDWNAEQSGENVANANVDWESLDDIMRAVPPVDTAVSALLTASDAVLVWAKYVGWDAPCLAQLHDAVANAKGES